MAYRLLGEHEGRRIRLLVFPGEYVLGFSPGADLQLMLPSVSRRHARLCLDGDRLSVEDLGSSHGTRLAGRPVRGVCEVQSGDRLEFGRVILRVERVGFAAEAVDLTLAPLAAAGDGNGMSSDRLAPGAFERYAFEALPGLLRAAAVGVDRTELARRLAESLYRWLPLRGVQITSRDGVTLLFEVGDIPGRSALVGAVEGLRLVIDFGETCPSGHERLFELAAAVLGLAPVPDGSG